MKYWLDTEFIEDGKTIDLLSIGIVAEDGREFYREHSGANLNNASLWVRQHVFPNMKWTHDVIRSPFLIRGEVKDFCNPKMRPY